LIAREHDALIRVADALQRCGNIQEFAESFAAIWREAMPVPLPLDAIGFPYADWQAVREQLAITEGGRP
jgi:hypothetical protein